MFDVGANEGQYAHMLRDKVGYAGLIVSFEPIPEAFRILRKKSKGDPRWLVVEGAIGEADAEQIFNVMAYPRFGSAPNVGWASTRLRDANALASIP